jgi:hypothetical protein
MPAWRRSVVARYVRSRGSQPRVQAQTAATPAVSTLASRYALSARAVRLSACRRAARHAQPACKSVATASSGMQHGPRRACPLPDAHDCANCTREHRHARRTRGCAASLHVACLAVAASCAHRRRQQRRLRCRRLRGSARWLRVYGSCMRACERAGVSSRRTRALQPHRRGCSTARVARVHCLRTRRCERHAIALARPMHARRRSVVAPCVRIGGSQPRVQAQTAATSAVSTPAWQRALATRLRQLHACMRACWCVQPAHTSAATASSGVQHGPRRACPLPPHTSVRAARDSTGTPDARAEAQRRCTLRADRWQRAACAGTDGSNVCCVDACVASRVGRACRAAECVHASGPPCSAGV